MTMTVASSPLANHASSYISLPEQARLELARRAQRELNRRRAQTSLAEFILYTYDGYQMGWFHREVCEVLDRFLADVIAKKSPRLIITAPPRSGKSEITSRRFPAYLLGRYPDLEVIACSYTAELAESMNRDLQRVIDSPEFHDVFPQTCLQGSAFAPVSEINATRTTSYFEIVNHKGKYRSTGVGGSITGMGAHVLIIDDPVKDRESANSETVRTKTWDWYTSTAYTRLAPGGGVIIMATRWHMDDLAGRLLSRMAENSGEAYELVNYPAIAEHDEKHRKQGEPLHPERFNLAALEKLRQNVGERDWASLYQQHPIPDGGALFKSAWLHYFKPHELPGHFDRMVISWDMTFKDTKNSDYVVGQVWGRKGASFYLIDQIRGQMDFVRTLSVFQELARRHPEVSRKLVEDKANGPAIIAMLRKEVPGIVPVIPKESKEARAYAVSTFWEAGNVFIPDPIHTPWVEREFIPELLSFPSSPHDDQVDAMTQALNDLKNGAVKFHASNMAYLGLGYS